MGISAETKQKMGEFAAEQSRLYLDDAELSYREKLWRKSRQARDRMAAKVDLFRKTSRKSDDARDDMVTYMADFIDDLMSQGLSEEEAFEKAKEQLTFQNETQHGRTLKEKYADYYRDMAPGVHEAIGLYYAGFMLLCGILGGIVGVFVPLGIWTEAWRSWMHSEAVYWWPVIVSAALGAGIGLALAMIKHASIVRK